MLTGDDLMSCQEMREKICMRLDGELTESETEELERHLKECPSCREYEKSLIEISSEMKLWEEIEVPSNLKQRIFTRILKKEKRTAKVWGISIGYYRIPAPLAWAAVLLFAFLAFHLAKDTFLKREGVTLETGYEVAAVQKEKAVPAKISITSEDIVSMTTNYKSINSEPGGFK